VTKLDEDTIPALYHHCVRMYRAMMDEATLVDMEGVQSVVYEGFLTDLVKNKLNLSTPYYTKCRKALLEMGCIKQLRRGGSSTPSQWLLIREPLLTNFDPEAIVSPPPITLEQYQAQQQQINALNQRMHTIEQILGLHS
jgi:hypothetical protein